MRRAYAVRVGPLEIIIVVVWFGSLLWALIDAASRPSEHWRAAGESKVFWIIVILLLQVIGALAYLLWIRRKLTGGGRPATS